MQIICALLQANNHASNKSLKFFYRSDALPDAQPQLIASSLDPADPPSQTPTRSNQPFCHNALDSATDRQTDRQTDRTTKVRVTKPVPTSAYALLMTATWLIILITAVRRTVEDEGMHSPPQYIFYCRCAQWEIPSLVNPCSLLHDQDRQQ